MPRKPQSGFGNACVESAPTPPSPCGQIAPTAKNLLATATPYAPLGSRAMMDQVMAGHYTRAQPMQPTFTTRPDIRGTFGAVATTHWLATQTGMAVLERGGNAFDAAVAAGFVLQIAEPHLNGPGGELPAIVFRAGADAPEVICGEGPFPAAANAARLRGMGLAQMPGTGLLPGVVPGAFDGWMLLLRDYGTLKLRDVLSYAIGYAEHGFPLVPRIVATIIPAVEYFRTEWPSSGEVWLVNGKPPHPDKPFRTPAIAETYKRILAEAEAAGSDRVKQIEAARHCFYKGFVAEAVDSFYKSELIDSTGKRHRG